MRFMIQRSFHGMGSWDGSVSCASRRGSPPDTVPILRGGGFPRGEAHFLLYTVYMRNAGGPMDSAINLWHDIVIFLRRSLPNGFTGESVSILVELGMAVRIAPIPPKRPTARMMAAPLREGCNADREIWPGKQPGRMPSMKKGKAARPGIDLFEQAYPK